MQNPNHDRFVQDIDLKCWKNLRALAYAYDHPGFIPEERSWVMALNVWKSNEHLVSIVEKEMSEKYQRDMKLDKVLLFKSMPWAEPDIHLDVMRENVSTVALNVPIYNTAGSYMEWWGGDYDSSQEPASEYNKGVSVIRIIWKNGGVLLHRAELVSPTLVRIDVPHRAVNPQPNKRMMLSLRFTPELTFLDQ